MNKAKLYTLLSRALGEIVLVTIGILIALQIDEWKEVSQHRKEEQRILSSLKNDLVNDTLQLTGHITAAQYRLAKIDTLYLALAQPDHFSAQQFLKLSYVLASSNDFKVNSGTFDESLSAGSLKYIRNDQLRQQTFEYYRYARLNDTDHFAAQQKFDIIFPVMFQTLSTTREWFDQVIGTATVFPSIDIKGLSGNTAFVAAVNQRYASEINQISSWQQFKTQCRDLITAIEQETADH